MWWQLQLQASPAANADQHTLPQTAQGWLSTAQASSLAFVGNQSPHGLQGELARAHTAPLSQTETPLCVQCE